MSKPCIFKFDRDTLITAPNDALIFSEFRILKIIGSYDIAAVWYCHGGGEPLSRSENEVKDRGPFV